MTCESTKFFEHPNEVKNRDFSANLVDVTGVRDMAFSVKTECGFVALRVGKV
jgi:hypothetical protein